MSNSKFHLEIKTVSIFKFKDDGSFNQERVNLNLTRKITARLDTSQILTYSPPPNALVKIIVKGTSAEIKALVKHNCIKELNKKGVKISYKHISDEPNSNTGIKIEGEGTRQVSYLERLYHAVKTDPLQEHMYAMIFGRLKKPPVLQIVL